MASRNKYGQFISAKMANKIETSSATLVKNACRKRRHPDHCYASVEVGMNVEVDGRNHEEDGKLPQ